METKQKEKSITLFIKERQKPTDPHLTGEIKDENGITLFRVVLWENTAKTGLIYYKGKLNDPAPKQ